MPGPHAAVERGHRHLEVHLHEPVGLAKIRKPQAPERGIGRATKGGEHRVGEHRGEGVAMILHEASRGHGVHDVLHMAAQIRFRHAGDRLNQLEAIVGNGAKRRARGERGDGKATHIGFGNRCSGGRRRGVIRIRFLPSGRRGECVLVVARAFSLMDVDCSPRCRLGDPAVGRPPVGLLDLRWNRGDTDLFCGGGGRPRFRNGQLCGRSHREGGVMVGIDGVSGGGALRQGIIQERFLPGCGSQD